MKKPQELVKMRIDPSKYEDLFDEKGYTKYDLVEARCKKISQKDTKII